MSHIFARYASQNPYARAEISRKCERFPHAPRFFGMREICARARVFWLAHSAKTGDKIFYLGPMPACQGPIIGYYRLLQAVIN